MKSSSVGKPIQQGIKRVVDISISLALLVVLLPILLIVAVAIRLDSPGPVLFRQSRLGRNGRPFVMLKFRTMVDNAERMGAGVYTFKGDPRVTRVGGILRRTSIDEIPQLVNVLVGDMSLVGPRPPLVSHPKKLEEYSEKEYRRFYVRPGITGLAQVYGRNAIGWNERFEYDTAYVDSWNILLDVKIAARTIIQVFLGRNVTVREGRGNSGD